jgi:hypothetical protein
LTYDVSMTNTGTTSRQVTLSGSLDSWNWFVYLVHQRWPDAWESWRSPTSACSAGSLTPSHVLLAMGLEDRLANSLIRFSLGRESTMADVRAVEKVLPEIIEIRKR